MNKKNSKTLVAIIIGIISSAAPLNISIADEVTLKWNVKTVVSPIDDTQNVYLKLNSNEPIVGKYGGAGPATMFIQCRENVTIFYVNFNNHFMADIQSYGTIIYRLDKARSKQKKMRKSTDNSALGLWSGNSSIPFIQAMFNHDKILIRATPYSESPITVTFSISGIETAIKPLRKSCSW